jgi:hypothetical protein
MCGPGAPSESQASLLSDSVFARRREVKAAGRVSIEAFQTCGRSGTSRPMLIVGCGAVERNSIAQPWNQENWEPEIARPGTTGYYSEARGTTKNCMFLLRNASICVDHGFVVSTVLATEFVAFRRDFGSCLSIRWLRVRFPSASLGVTSRHKRQTLGKPRVLALLGLPCPVPLYGHWRTLAGHSSTLTTHFWCSLFFASAPGSRVPLAPVFLSNCRQFGPTFQSPRYIGHG